LPVAVRDLSISSALYRKVRAIGAAMSCASRKCMVDALMRAGA